MPKPPVRLINPPSTVRVSQGPPPPLGQKASLPPPAKVIHKKPTGQLDKKWEDRWASYKFEGKTWRLPE